jgi:hypothetical protein
MVRRTAELKTNEWRNAPDECAAPGETTLDSPVEALGLSVRSSNRLHQLGCHSVGFLIDNEFARGRARLGPRTRNEVAAALVRCGFTVPPDLTPRRGTRIAQLARALLELRRRIDIDQRRWRGRLERLEQQIRKLSE